MNKEVYLDNAATTHVHPKVLKHLVGLYEKGIANPSSIHHAGVLANVELEKTRAVIASKLNCKPEEIYFTSGATESNNLVLKGLLPSFSKGDEIIISTIEHSCVRESAESLSSHGINVKKVNVDRGGFVNFLELEKMLAPKTKLISIIHANNEIGVIQDLEKIGKLCKEKKILFHSDGAQAFCKTPVDVQKMNLDFYSMSGHKIHAPKGIGATYIKNGIKLSPQLHGGKQESGVRAGTVAVELASAMAEASKLFTPAVVDKLASLKTNFTRMLLDQFPDLRINGSLESSLPNIVNFAIPQIEGKHLLRELDKVGVRVSVGSACNSGQKKASHVLMSLGLSEAQANEAIRVSLGVDSVVEDMEKILLELKKIRELRYVV